MTCDLCGRTIDGDAVTTELGTFCRECDREDEEDFIRECLEDIREVEDAEGVKR